ncbi:hypothetical protein SYNPS1DRAFT_30101 [Syncephalis pseudoplumigaleata]|uniref:Uncharacterized protein n=1 Tax=Syncephalis pseudoplumigaleata TaxID=1712513 RepID=A0A4P9YXS5_9FUNG|nr:hypothetical protein SYNPS1DRAFT_30101 [Syncephalis pseudoplumigaleata]|eukprot:RKP24131.1 hypothetical protein SYNPS1DRAFT_30101 [Syncephalis pseudoplumigaleata]
MPSGPSGRVWSMGPVSAAHQSERRLEVNGKRFVCDGIGGRNGAKECSWNGEDLATGQFVDEVNGKVFADDGGGHRRSRTFRGLEDVAASVNLMVVDRGQVFQVQKGPQTSILTHSWILSSWGNIGMPAVSQERRTLSLDPLHQGKLPTQLLPSM